MSSVAAGLELGKPTKRRPGAVDEPSKPRPGAVGVLRAGECDLDQLRSLLSRFGMRAEIVAPGVEIPGSYWGESEAGLIGDALYFRADTPVHSILHEGGHFICMDPRRRASLVRDAGGDHAEENGVCYLQILLADAIRGFGRERMLRDMDAWGYTFRLGSAKRWFEEDAADARAWLLERNLIDRDGQVRWNVFSEPQEPSAQPA